jgi:hypothetical protein
LLFGCQDKSPSGTPATIALQLINRHGKDAANQKVGRIIRLLIQGLEAGIRTFPILPLFRSHDRREQDRAMPYKQSTIPNGP